MAQPTDLSSPIEWPPQTARIISSEAKDLSSYDEAYATYSGADIVASMLIPGEDKPLVLGGLQTISYSTHRENKPVRFLGHSNPCGWVRGPRTIAGSLIFTNFSTYVFYQIEEFRKLTAGGLFPLADMIPAFDIVISFMHETGSFSKMKIFGVQIIDEGGTMSIDDLVTESTYTWMARGIQPMVGYKPANLESAFETEVSAPTFRPTIEVL